MQNATTRFGFTLVEIIIVASIISLLIAIGVPTMRNAGEQARNKRFAREIITASHAFVQYAFENGGYPADKTPSQMPEGMVPYLKSFPWTEKTVIGGQWDWDFRQFGVYAAVSVYNPNWDNDRMQRIDAIIDDGNLGTGQFRSRSGGYMYVLEELTP